MRTCLRPEYYTALKNEWPGPRTAACMHRKEASCCRVCDGSRAWLVAGQCLVHGTITTARGSGHNLGAQPGPNMPWLCVSG